MSHTLEPGINAVVPAHELAFELEPAPADETLSGAPLQGIHELGALGGVEAGVWELRGGTVRDTEVDELFVVLSGSATITLLDEGREVEVRAGDVMRLVAGTRTEWNVPEHIRKVYLTPSAA